MQVATSRYVYVAPACCLLLVVVLWLLVGCCLRLVVGSLVLIVGLAVAVGCWFVVGGGRWFAV